MILDYKTSSSSTYFMTSNSFIYYGPIGMGYCDEKFNLAYIYTNFMINNDLEAIIGKNSGYRFKFDDYKFRKRDTTRCDKDTALAITYSTVYFFIKRLMDMLPRIQNIDCNDKNILTHYFKELIFLSTYIVRFGCFYEKIAEIDCIFLSALNHIHRQFSIFDPNLIKGYGRRMRFMKYYRSIIP